MYFYQNRFNIQIIVWIMQTSKFKLILSWILFVSGFYLFWLLSYLLSVRYVLSQLSRLYGTGDNSWSQLTIDDAFWFFLFIAGIALVMYILKQFTIRAPNSRIAAIIYVLLILSCVIAVLSKLFSTTTTDHLLPHILINLLFVAAILYPVIINQGNLKEVEK